MRHLVFAYLLIIAMAAPSSRLERLVDLIGEDNLPAKLPEITVTPIEDNIETTENEKPKGSFDKLQSVVDFMKEQNSSSTEWWNNMPTKSQPAKQPKPLHPQSAPTPRFVPSADGGFASDERCGEVAPLGIAFAPFLAVTKLPCTCIGTHRKRSSNRMS